VLIEQNLKEVIPAISNVVVIGEKRKYLSCLVTLKSEVDADGLPTQRFAGDTLELVQRAKSTASTIDEAIACPKVKAKIEGDIKRANEKAISRAQYIRKFHLLSGDFTQEGGELTPTMKLKRNVVNDKYSKEIASMYPEDDNLPLSKL
jgi:long-chain-fatty-acid--CoA ligase ACSBG